MRKIDLVLYMVAFIFLIMPYGIMVLSKKLEPYPAIILPDGSSKVSYDTKSIKYSRIKLVGVDADSGMSRTIDSDMFFDPIPSNRIYGFANNGFGLEGIRNDTFLIRKSLFSPIVVNKKYSNSDSQELKNWYRSKLTSQGLLDSSFTFMVEDVIIDRSTSEVIDSSIYRQENYRLYD